MKSAAITQPVTLSKVSQSDGAFFFTNLPPGSYKLCGQLLGSNLLDPCQWSPNPPMVNVTAGQIISNGLIAMQAGVLVLVRLDSPDAVLATQAKGKPDNQVLAIVRATEGFPHFMPAVVDDAAGRTHALVVPFDVALTLSLHSPKLKVFDKDGKDKSDGDPIPVRVKKGDPPVTLRFTVKEK